MLMGTTQMDQNSQVSGRIRSVGGLPWVPASAAHITKKPMRSRATPMMMRNKFEALRRAGIGEM